MADTPAASPAVETPAVDVPTGVQSTEAPETGDAKTVAEAIAELQDGDFDKVLPIKDESGKVHKIKVKDLVKEVYTNRTKAKRAQDAAEQRVGATVKELVQYAKTNPKDFMSRIGIDPEQFAEMTLTEKVKALEMTPEQRKLAEYEAKLKEYESKQREIEETTKKSQAQAEYEKAVMSLDQEVTEAISQAGLPKSKFFVQMALAKMHDDLVRYEREVAEHGVADRPPLNAKEALGIVKELVPKLVGEVLSGMELNQLRQMLGKRFDELKAEDIKRVQHQDLENKPSIGKPAKKEKEPVFTKDSDYRAWVESRKQALS